MEDVVSLSGVNKHFHREANSQELWKFLYSRDYGSGNENNITLKYFKYKKTDVFQDNFIELVLSFPIFF